MNVLSKLGILLGRRTVIYKIAVTFLIALITIALEVALYYLITSLT